MQSTRTRPVFQDSSSLGTTAVDRLRLGQIVILAAVSILFWFLAALFIQYGVPAGAFGGAAGAALFALSVPRAWSLVWTIRRAAALRPGQLLPGVAIASAVAMLCDWVALTWFPALYGQDAEGRSLGAAWLLWGVGVSFIVALADTTREGA